jgi:hypothetical protein
MTYCIRVGDDLFIKRTAQFGLFHGAIQYTDRQDQALQFTHKQDAEQRAEVACMRIKRSVEIDGKEWHKLQKLGLAADVSFTVESMPG